MALQPKRHLDSESPSSSNSTDWYSDQKKPKLDDNDNDEEYDTPISSSFIDELNDLEEEEMMRSGRTGPQTSHTPSGSGSSSNSNSNDQKTSGNQETRTKTLYGRPPPPPIDPAGDTISFQQLDIDHYVGNSLHAHVSSDPTPVLRMFGVTMGGNSVCAHIHNFRPYFYVPLPHSEFKSDHCGAFREALNRAVIGDMRSNRDGITTAIEAVEICDRCSMYGYHGGILYPFLKIIVSLPKLVAPAKRLVCSIQLPPFQSVCSQSFESNIEYEIRYMVDAKVVGCNWIDCPPGI